MKYDDEIREYIGQRQAQMMQISHNYAYEAKCANPILNHYLYDKPRSQGNFPAQILRIRSITTNDDYATPSDATLDNISPSTYSYHL